MPAAKGGGARHSPITRSPLRNTSPLPRQIGPPMKIAIGSDHRGFEAKRRLLGFLKHFGHEVVDVGAAGPESVDYPDFAFQVANRVSTGEVERGILICGTSIGMCIAANKVKGVRAAPCHDSMTAAMTR